MPLTVADNYDAELRRLNDRFCAATGIRRTDCVLDIGCGAGQTSRDAARAAVAGKVLGVDVPEQSGPPTARTPSRWRSLPESSRLWEPRDSATATSCGP